VQKLKEKIFSNNVLNRWKYWLILNVHGVNDVIQIEIYMRDSGSFEFEVSVEMLIQGRGKTSCSEIHKLLNSIESCHSSGRHYYSNSL
jgi:hypothetical protein